MKYWHEVFLGLAVLACIPAGFAQAGFTGVCVEPVDVDGGLPSWACPPGFEFNAADSQLILTEKYEGPIVLAHDISGSTDTDPTLNIVKEINNDSGFTWNGFELTLPYGGGNTFTGTPICTAFTLVSQSLYQVVFGLPSALPDGDSMTLRFDVLVPSTGPFSFTLTQTPIAVPEPSTMVVLVAGCAVLLLRLRKK